MKLKIFINTYDSNQILNNFCLKSIFNSQFDEKNVEIFIIDNHSNIFVEGQYIERVKIIENQLRPDFSTGHLSRNWNLALINGFENLNQPACDAVILVQVDSVFNKDWFSNILKIHNENILKYVTYGAGDQFQYFTPEAIKNIGLYDERFCNIGFQEGDYFLRAVKYYPESVSINDYRHKRVHNPIELNFLDTQELQTGAKRRDSHHLKSFGYHKYSSKVYFHKWDIASEPCFYTTAQNAKLKISNYILYPYFENSIPTETLIKQNYIIP